MYYSWSWWVWLFWVLPLIAFVWLAFGSSSRRSGYGSRYPYLRGYRRGWDWDDDSYWSPGSLEQRGQHRGRGPRNYHRSDERIFEEINDRLTVSENLDASDIDVQVVEGKVTLRGTVASRIDKRQAENIADWVAGVTDVDNQLKIAGQQRQVSEPRAAEPPVAQPPTPHA